MTSINKQKFLIELGRLLTFMSEEDRLEALTLYEKMFDDTDDEQALIQALLSPTRQAVVIARAYDANARRLQAHARANKNNAEPQEPEATPDFVMAILQVYEECVPLPVEDEAAALEEAEEEAPAVMADQFSLFEDDGQPTEDSVYGQAFLVHDAPEEPAAVEETEEVPEARAAAEPFDEVDSFIAGFSIVDDELDPASGESRAIAAEEPEEDELLEWVASRSTAPEQTARKELGGNSRRPVSTVLRPKVFLLILFILIACPLTLLGIALLLIPTLLSLGLAAGCIVSGCAGAVAAFSGFPVFADILIVLGCAIIALALGLLFLWLFIWFVGGAIVGLVRSVMELGRSWCYEEVPA